MVETLGSVIVKACFYRVFVAMLPLQIKWVLYPFFAGEEVNRDKMFSGNAPANAPTHANSPKNAQWKQSLKHSLTRPRCKTGTSFTSFGYQGGTHVYHYGYVYQYGHSTIEAFHCCRFSQNTCHRFLLDLILDE